MTSISWTDETWNPVTGCSKLSPGCLACYAERLSHKWRWTSKAWTEGNAAENVRLHPDRLPKPLHWREPRMVFVCSMSDLFHPLVPDAFVDEVLFVCRRAGRHTFQVLTKRPERALGRAFPPNVWFGVSVEDRARLGRLDVLRRVEARVRFVSFEPLLEALGPVDLSGIGWVIVGGESGPAPRPMDHAWAREIRDRAVAAGVPFFFKQSSAARPETRKELLEADGTRRAWQERPEAEVA